MKTTQSTLRPADVVVAVQLSLDPGLSYASLANRVELSTGEVHNAVKRLQKSRIVRPGSRDVSRRRLREFILHGVQYAFPPELGPETRGVPTAHAAPILAPEFGADAMVVWPFADGSERGQSLTPLYPAAPKLERSNMDLYTILTLIDTLRIGQTRERKRAGEHLERLLG